MTATSRMAQGPQDSRRASNAFPDFVSQSHVSPSEETEASLEPSGLKATLMMLLANSGKDTSFSPLRASRIVMAFESLTNNRLPSGVNFRNVRFRSLSNGIRWRRRPVDVS